jgi:two-component system, OmpR family, sensor kinase
MNIRTRLALWYSGLLTLIIIIFSIVVITVSRVSLIDAVDRWISRVAYTVVAHIYMDPDQEHGVSIDTSENLHTGNVIVHVWQIAHPQTGESLPTPMLLYPTPGTSPVLPDIDPLSTSSRYTTIQVNSSPERLLSLPIYTQNNVRYGIVQVSTPIQWLSQSNQQLLVITLVTAIACIGFSVMLGIFLSRRMLRPIKAITQAAASIVDTDALSTRLEWSGPKDELGELTDVFNHMMERLEGVFNGQQRFIGDVSHELRTPLTSILGNLELMQMYGVKDDLLEGLQREAERMQHLVEDLILLNRADFGGMEMDFYVVDLDTIAQAAYNNAQKRLANRNISLTMNRLEPITLVGNRDRLQQAIAYLLHNAIKFTPQGGKVSLSVYKANNKAIIDVQDTGIGIAPEHLKHIFDRFYKADPSRVRRDDSDGAGLSLSIARWIVETHEGTITVESKEGKGSLFRVTLPLELKKSEQFPNGLLDETDIPALKIKTRPIESESEKDKQKI